MSNKSRSWKRWTVRGAAVATLIAVFALCAGQFMKGSVIRGFNNGELVSADYWGEKPKILAGGFGFDNIIGVPELTADAARDAGGSWYGSLKCTSGQTPAATLRTSVAESATIPQGYDGYADHDDGLPIEFSWPVATETVNPTDFKFTLNTGKVVFAHAAGMNPNWENNERSTVVLFGDFGNRRTSSDPDVVFPVRVEVVADETPLRLIGPKGREVSGVGLTWTTDKTPYDRGPSLVAAKLTNVLPDPPGEGGVGLPEHTASMPNDEVSLYGNRAEFRLRVLTSGGFSPDGVTGLRPDMYEDFFRLRVRSKDGKTTLVEKSGVDYEVAGGSLRVVGLSDLGQRADAEAGIAYDDCYEEDQDNQIDIILAGDASAVRNIESVEIPSLSDGYRAFYNPGGPGPEPFDDVRYTAPGPADTEPVTIALDDPMQVSRDARRADPSFVQFAMLFVFAAALLALLAFRVRRWRSEEG